MIVTFNCQNGVFIYDLNKGVHPAYPFEVHKSVGDAIIHLIENNKDGIYIKII